MSLLYSASYMGTIFNDVDLLTRISVLFIKRKGKSEKVKAK